VRKTQEIVIPGVPSEELGARDNGKIFLLTEMPAEEGELWAAQALLLLEQAGVKGASEQHGKGMAGVAAVAKEGELAQVRALQDPSLASMWKHVKFQPADRKVPPQPLFAGDACQIEEIGTRLMLRGAFLALHINFFTHRKGSTSASASGAAAS
jgi:hypothetical protein